MAFFSTDVLSQNGKVIQMNVVKLTYQKILIRIKTSKTAVTISNVIFRYRPNRIIY